MPTFEELTGIVNDPEAVRPIQTIHDSGADTRREAAIEAEETAEETTLGGLAKAAWEGNITPQFVDAVQRKWDHEPEQGFDPAVWLDANKDSLTGMNVEAFADVRSTGEAEELRDDQVRSQENQRIVASKGYTGVAATILSGIVDPAELVIGIATAGSGKAVTIADKLWKGAKAGALGGAVAGTLQYQVDPNADTKQIVYGTLGGVVLGGAMGTLATNNARKTAADYSDALDDLPPADRVYNDAAPFTMGDNPMSLGAGAQDMAMDATEMNNVHKSIFDQAQTFIRDNDLATRMEDTDLATDTAANRTAKRFSDALASDHEFNVLQTDFDRMQNGGTIERVLGYQLLESAEGRLRNNRSAAMLQENYESRLATHSMPVMEESYTGWAKRNNIGLIDRQRPATRAAFDREVVLELEARYHEGGPVSTDPHIKAAADGIDKNYAEALKIGKGRAGETSIDGFQDIQEKSGFFNHTWDGNAIKRATELGHSKEAIQALIAKGIRQTNEAIDDEMAGIIAKAIVRRSRAKADGIDTNMLSTLDADAQDYLREMLRDSGHDDKMIDRLIESIRGRKEEQSKLGTTKARVQLDLRLSENGLSLVDLVDTNLTRVMSRYNRTVAGNAALARKGIANRQQRKQMIEAALAERRARGMPAGEDQRRFLEDMFTYFDSGPIGGGTSRHLSRAKRVTNLALLNQMGLTQMAEVGAQVASVGFEAAARHTSIVTKQLFKEGPDGGLLQELKPLMGDIGNEHMLFREDLMMDELADSVEANKFIASLDTALAKGQRAQGYLSGFYKVRQMQQKIAVSSQADKVMQRLRDGVDEAEIKTAGFDMSIKRYIDDGTVEFKDGYVNKLNIDRWDAEDAENFALSLHRHTNQVVQKAMAGEQSMWMHKGFGPLIMHLKAFPITAMRKQTIRIAGMSNQTLVMTTLMGMATAALMTDVKQVINGRSDRVTAETTLKGALAMSNMTGWAPMLYDPAVAILGMPDMRMSQYGRYDINTGVLSSPPILTTLSKMAQLPGAVNPMGDLTENERIRIMQTTPLVGNLYGFSALFNAMKN